MYSVENNVIIRLADTVTFVTLIARGVRYSYRIVSSSGKYIPGIGYGLRIENKDRDGPPRCIVDIFNIIPKVRDTGIHLKVVDEEPMADYTRK